MLQVAEIAGLDSVLDTCTADPMLTLFAPTNGAFEDLRAALGEEVWEALIADPALLEDILLYHVLPGTTYAADFVTGPYTTLLGQDIDVDAGDGVIINGTALVVEADYAACNGVIHVIDEVLVPEIELPTPTPEPEPEPEPTPAEPEESETTTVPVLPTTGIGPEQPGPGWLFALGSLAAVAARLGVAALETSSRRA